METTLIAEPRSDTGKGFARRLRAAGRIPGVLYGHGMDPQPLSVDAHDLMLVMHKGSNVLIDLKVDSESHLTLAKDVVRDHIKGRFIHVDFLTINRDEKITVNVPIQSVGESAGVKEGGVLEHNMWEVEVECLPFDVPGEIQVDVSALGIGDSIHVSELTVPADVEILTNPEELVLQVVQPQARGIEGEGVEGEEGEAVEGEAVEGEEATSGGEGDES
jgi:large subunit ribosomal protein L25